MCALLRILSHQAPTEKATKTTTIMGRGLKVDTPQYNRVKEQLLEGKWDVSHS
jgi:hypothetical protein